MTALYTVNFAAADNADFRNAFQLTDTAGAPMSLVGAAIAMAFQTPSGQTVLAASTADGRIAVSEPTGGTFEIAIPAADLTGLPAGIYRHDLVVTSGGRKTRIWAGHMTLEQGVAA